jgi:hypothetical protein
MTFGVVRSPAMWSRPLFVRSRWLVLGEGQGSVLVRPGGALVRGRPGRVAWLFVGGCWWDGGMPRHREPHSPAAPPAGGGGAARPPDPPGPARGRPHRDRLGGRPADRHPGRRRPARRAGPARGTAPQAASRGWRVGRLISILRDKAGQAGITLTLVGERGTSSTCPACRARVPKPAGRVFRCPRCGLSGHRDLIAAANIAGRLPGGITPAIPAGVTHRRAGNHLPGVSRARRDPRRRPHHGAVRGSPDRHLPAPPVTVGRGVARPTARTS